jgi:hypothetical protein
MRFSSLLSPTVLAAFSAAVGCGGNVVTGGSGEEPPTSGSSGEEHVGQGAGGSITHGQGGAGGSTGDGHGGHAGVGGSDTGGSGAGGHAVSCEWASDNPGFPCTPGQTVDCPVRPAPENACPAYTATCGPVSGMACAGWDSDPTCGCYTPLVLSFDGAPVEYLTDREHAFDLSGVRSQITDWPTARTPWLVLDRDGSGAIEDGSELFGSMTVLSSGRRARQGFEALRELDANGDGRITADDPAFAELRVWSDRDGDRVSSPGELTSLAALGIVSLDLAFTIEPRCDARGNCEVERASFRYVDASGVERRGALIDVHMAAHR